MECKKKLQFSGSLPSAMGKALGKVFSKKNPEILCRVPGLGHSAKYFKKKIKKLCRVSGQGHSAKYFF